MILDKQSASDFAYACHDKLAEKMKISGNSPEVKIRTLGEMHGYIKEFVPKAVETSLDDYSKLCEVFNLQKVDVSEAFANMAMSAATMPSSYDSEKNRINVVLYSDVNSLNRLYADAKSKPPINPAQIIETNARMLPEAIAESIGQSLRAEARNYAGTNSLPDSLIVAKRKGLFGKKVLFNSENIRNPSTANFLKGKLNLVEPLNLQGFFSPIGAIEGAEEMRGTKYEFEAAANSNFMGSPLKDNININKAIITSGASSPKTVRRISEAVSKKVSEACISQYRVCPEAFRKAIYSDENPLMGMNEENVVRNFFFENFDDIDYILPKWTLEFELRNV